MDQGGDIELILIVVNKKARPQRLKVAESLIIQALICALYFILWILRTRTSSCCGLDPCEKTLSGYTSEAGHDGLK